MSYQRFKKRGRVAKSPFFAKKKKVCKNNLIKRRFFSKKPTFFESPITQKRSIFEQSYISYGKRQKSCTLIVIKIILSYLTSPILNSSSKSTGFFFFANEEIYKRGLETLNTSVLENYWTYFAFFGLIRTVQSVFRSKAKKIVKFLVMHRFRPHLKKIGFWPLLLLMLNFEGNIFFQIPQN